MELIYMASQSTDGNDETKADGKHHGRAILTESNRDILTGKKDVSDNHAYKTRSTILQRIREELPEDLAILKQNHPDAYETIVEMFSDGPDLESEDDDDVTFVKVGDFELMEEQENTRVGLAAIQEVGGDDQTVIIDEDDDPGDYRLFRVIKSENVSSGENENESDEE